MRTLALLLLPVLAACGDDVEQGAATAGANGGAGAGGVIGGGGDPASDDGGLGGGAGDAGGQGGVGGAGGAGAVGDADGGAGGGDGGAAGQAGGLDDGGAGAGDAAGGGADVGGGDPVFEPGWVASGLAWRGTVCPADPSAVQRDVGLTLVRQRGVGGEVDPAGPNDSVGDCQLQAGAGDGCMVGPDDFQIIADRIVDPGGICGEAEGCSYPMDKELPVEAMDLRPDPAGTALLALVFDGSARLDGIGGDGLAEPGRAADRNNRRIAAAKTLVGQLDNTDDVAVWVASGAGPQAVRELAAMSTDRGATHAALDSLSPADVNTEAPLHTAVAAAAAAGATAVVLFTAGPPTDAPEGPLGVPLHIIHLDNPAVRGGPSGPLWDLAQIACDSAGSYVRVEAADALDSQFADIPLRVGAYADLVVDFATALGDQGVPPGADVTLYLDAEVKLAGEVLILDDIPLPLRIP